MMTISDVEGEDKFRSQPTLPHGRPPTRGEVWEYVQHWYGDLKDLDELARFAKELFIGNYVYSVNFNGWTNPPDWQEGKPVVAAACPKGPLPFGFTNQQREVYRLLELQREES